MTLETAQKIEAHFFALRNVTARRAFVLALIAAGHKCVYLDKGNGDSVTAFRMYNDDGSDFKR